MDQADDFPEGADDSPQMQAARAQRFFICNTNRKEFYQKGEDLMRSSEYAVAWEDFRYTRDMEAVRSGDMILLYANQAGIIAVGTAIGACEVLEPDDPRRVSNDFNNREWRIPVRWLKWANVEDACPWKGILPPTFHDVSGEKWSDHRDEVIRHFFGDMKSIHQRNK
jgi:hypothetical protein